MDKRFAKFAALCGHTTKVAAISLGMTATLIGSIQTANAQTGGSYSNQSLAASLDSFVQTDSQGWWVNTYDRGSMNNVSITNVRDNGHTFTVRGYYTFNSGSRGYVDALISNNQLVCLEFWDASGCNAMRTQPAPYAAAAITAIAVAVLARAASGSGSSSGSSSESSNGNQDYYYYRNSPAPTAPEPAPDTSVGCVWGDRAYGTCH